MTPTPPHLTLCELEETGTPGLESFSPHCVKVRRALRLAGFSYDRRLGSPDAFRGTNPAGDVALLLVDGREVADSMEILSLLDVLSGGALTNGLDRKARAEAFLWEGMADAVLNDFVVAARWLDEDNWPRTRDAYFAAAPGPVRPIVSSRLRSRVRERLEARAIARPALDACWSRFVVILDELEARAPHRGYWLGDAPSRADIAIFAQLFSLRTSLTPRQHTLLAARKRLSCWLDRVQACDRGAPARAAALSPASRRVTAAFA